MRSCAGAAIAATVFVSACALHPIPEDVVGVSTRQIVQHIRCEIKEAIKEHGFKKKGVITDEDIDKQVVASRAAFVLNGVDTMREKGLKLLHNDAYVETRQIRTVSSSVEFDKIIDLTKEKEKLICDLVGANGCSADTNLRSEMTKFVKNVYLDAKCINDELDDYWSTIRILPPRELPKIAKYRNTLEGEIRCLRAKHRYYQATSPKARDDTLEKAWKLCGAQMCRPGLRDVASVLRITETKIEKAKKLKEDLDEEKKKQKENLVRSALHEGFKGVAVGYNFKFEMTDKDTSSLDLDFTLPFSKTAFSLDMALAEKKTRANSRDFLIAEDIANVMIDSTACDELRTVNWRYPLAGKVGLAETIKAYVSLAEIEGFFEKKKSGDEFTEELEFTTEIERGDFSPSFPFTGAKSQFRLVKITPKFMHKRTDVHKLTLTFTKAEAKEDDQRSGDIPYGGRSSAVEKALEILKDRRYQGFIGKTIRQELLRSQ